MVALRGRHRWVRGVRPARPAAPAARVRKGGLYLVLGRGEGRGPLIAEALASRGARVVGSLEEAGDEALAGVFLSPALGTLAEPGAIAEAEPGWSDALAELAASLDAADRALEGRAPAVRMVESSLAGMVGIVGRVRAAAAHALVDGWATARGWTAVGWDRDAGGPDDPAGFFPGDVPAALDAALALAGEPQVLLSPMPLEARIRAAFAPAPSASSSAAQHPRPEMEVEYHAPSTETEERLAALWESLLGIERIGVHDDFFGLGGHSLLATQIVARVRDLFALDLPLASIFEAPTIASYAELVEEAIIAELEELSEEEAREMAGA